MTLRLGFALFTGNAVEIVIMRFSNTLVMVVKAGKSRSVHCLVTTINVFHLEESTTIDWAAHSGSGSRESATVALKRHKK